MNKIEYNKIKKDNTIKTNSFEYEGQTIEVTQYLSAKDKYDLINITLQNSLVNGAYDLFLLDIYFTLNLIYMYTNIEFPPLSKDDSLNLYDELLTNGFVDKFLTSMNTNEYDELFEYVSKISKAKQESLNSLTNLFRNVIKDLPAQAKAAKDIVESFDPKKYREVIDFATAANGGRNIVTNKPIG